MKSEHSTPQCEPRNGRQENGKSNQKSKEQLLKESKMALLFKAMQEQRGKDDQ